MAETIDTRAEPTGATREAPAPRARWGRALLLGLVVFGAYLVNRASMVTNYDTVATMFVSHALARGDGPYVDRFASILQASDGNIPEWATMYRGHIMSRHPIGAAVVAMPLMKAQIWYLERFVPGWDRDADFEFAYSTRICKNASAVLAALVTVVLSLVLDRLGLGRVALPAILAGALGSELWVVGSQEPWQHGPAALALALILALLLPRPVPWWRLALAGLATAALVAIRPIDIVFAAVVTAGLLVTQPRGLAWFLPPAVPIAVALLGYNIQHFQTIEGGQAQLEAMHPTIHAVRGIWTGHLGEGMAGTLVSPARGLFVYCPWIALALAALPATYRRIRAYPVVAWLLWGLVPYLLMLSKYSVWWAGHCFGPRYWTDATPVFVVVLGFALDWAWARCRPLLPLFALAIAWSVAVQAIGAFYYPSSWCLAPANVDLHHERLWQWRDHELTRCLREGRKSWSE